VRLGIVKPGLYAMQVRAIAEAACDRTEAGGNPVVEIMIPLTVTREELLLARGWVEEAIAAVEGADAKGLAVTIGTMIETPRAALLAGELAEHAEFFSFGTNDLTQLTYGFSRDDVERQVLASYQERGFLTASPFARLDPHGVGALIALAVERARSVRPDIKLGVCGEHGGDPDSIAFCDDVGLDYVSCSAHRVPVARMAAAHSALRKSESRSASNENGTPA